MSRSTTSGRNRRADSQAARPSRAISTWCPGCGGHGRSTPRGRGCRPRRGSVSGQPSVVVRRAVGPLRPGAGRASAIAGRRTTNSLPLPAPSLWASTVPPCSSTSRRPGSGRCPAPLPTGRASRSTWVNRSKIPGSISAAMPTPSSSTRMHGGIVRRAGPTAGCGRPRACTWRRCSAGSATTWASRVGSPSTRKDSPGDVRPRGACPARVDQRAAGLDGVARRPSATAERLPGEA